VNRPADWPTDWSLSIDEVSVGVYQVCAIHPSGPRVELEGTDLDELLVRCRHAIEDLAAELRRKTVLGEKGLK